MPARRPMRPNRPSGRRPPHHDDVLPVDPDLAPDDPAEPSVSHRPTVHVRRSAQPRALVAIALGGFLGSLARFEVTRAWPSGVGQVPWATFLINTSGALFLGLVLTLLLERTPRCADARPFLCVGFTGAWTTMSSLALEADLLGRGGHIATAILYIALTVVAGLAMSWVGIAVGRRVATGTLRWPSR